MTPFLRLAGFAVALTVILGAGYAVGSTLDSGPAAPRSGTGDGAHGGHGVAQRTPQPASGDVAGLSVTDRGYALRLGATRVPGGNVSISFTIAGPHGSAVTSYQVEHEKELHLIAVRRDFTGFQHVHPTRDASGVWSTRLDLRPGSWRVFADFVPADGGRTQGLTLGSDLEVSGAYAPAPPAKPTPSVNVDDLTVTLTGRPSAGHTSDLAFRLTRGGRDVEPEPYLGARGHLVVLREGDLAYLHVHPDEDALSFATEVATPGRYRLFLDVKVDGTVRTAEFTVEVGA